jgi:glutathione S-transferase
MIVALETGLGGRLELVPGDPWAPDTDLPQDNPLNKLPALLTDEGERLYDSPVICEYLDSLHGGDKLFPAAGSRRWIALRRQALADGLLDACVQLRVETTMRPDPCRWAKWSARQTAIIERALDQFESEAPDLAGPFTIGHVALVCALGFLDFRSIIADWRDRHPRLAAWYAEAARRPSVVATTPHD